MNSWVGQGLIAEKFLKKEAMELFQHSTKLGYHDEAVLGYAHWVLSVLLNPVLNREPSSIYFIENMHAISAAADVLTWYTGERQLTSTTIIGFLIVSFIFYVQHPTLLSEREPNDVYALNTHGLLLERQKLHKSAADRFAAALELSTNEHSDMINLNLARVMLQLERYDEAVRLCGQVKHSNFNSQCHLALSMFKGMLLRFNRTRSHLDQNFSTSFSLSFS